MARHFYLDAWRPGDGTEVTATIRTEEPAGIACAAFGTGGGSSGIEIHDPDRSFDIKGWHPFWVEEDEADPTRIFTGFVLGKDITKRPEGGWIWDCTLMDLNRIPGMRAMRNGHAKRDPESDIDRINYMLHQADGGIRGLVFDNGGISASERPFGEADLRGEKPEQTLSNLALDRRYWFIYWDETADEGREVSLWYRGIGQTRGDLTAWLTDDPDDFSDPNAFASVWTSLKLERSPEDTYDGVYFTYRGDRVIYRRDSDTTAEFFAVLGPGFGRDLVYSTDRITSAGTASDRVDEFLAAASVERDTITCSVHVLASQVNRFREGFRCQVRFDLPGYNGDPVWVTILERTIKVAPDAIDRYELDLTLIRGAPPSTGGGEGGGGGEFPHDPEPAGPDATGDICNTVMEDSVRFADVDFGELAVEGDEWYFEVQQTSHTAGAVVTGLSLSSGGVSPAELFDLLSLYDIGEIGTGAGSPPLPLKSGTFVVGSQVVTGPEVFHLRLDTDYLGPGVTVDECFHIEMWRGSGPPTVPPPTQGQRFGPIVPLEAPDGTRTTFTLPAGYEFGDNTLEVFVDRLDQTAAVTSYDGACREFTLAFAPLPGELIEVYGQGR